MQGRHVACSKHVRDHRLRDCAITTCDITNAKAISGPALDAIRGKTTRRSPMPAQAHYVSVPRLIRERNRDLDISADLFFVNGLAFLVTRSRRLRFITVEVLADQLSQTMTAAMAQAVNLYKCFGFDVHICFADGQFAALEHTVGGLHFDTSGHNEHVGDAERVIRAIKERVRSIRSSIPCSRLPRGVIIELVTFIVFLAELLPPPWWGITDVQPSHHPPGHDGQPTTALSPAFRLTRGGTRQPYDHQRNSHDADNARTVPGAHRQPARHLPFLQPKHGAHPSPL